MTTRIVHRRKNGAPPSLRLNRIPATSRSHHRRHHMNPPPTPLGSPPLLEKRGATVSLSLGSTLSLDMQVYGGNNSGGG
ncbi:hypothetical protein Hanom_Chr01g00010031 [Helianthus anomalus]